MREEYKLKASADRGRRAAQILEDKIVQEALTNMRETVYHNIRTSKFTATEEREELYRMLKAIDGFEKELTVCIKGGQKAKSLLDKLFKEKKGE